MLVGTTKCFKFAALTNKKIEPHRHSRSLTHVHIAFRDRMHGIGRICHEYLVKFGRAAILILLLLVIREVALEALAFRAHLAVQPARQTEAVALALQQFLDGCRVDLAHIFVQHARLEVDLFAGFWHGDVGALAARLG